MKVDGLQQNYRFAFQDWDFRMYDSRTIDR